MNTLFLQVAYEQKERLEIHKRLISRDLISKAIQNLRNDNRVLIITGMRRVGKSTLLRQLMQETGNFCYLNFEDEKLIGFTVEQFGELLEALLQVYGPSSLYFFDEIQNVEHYEIAVRKFQDNGKKVIITGSNSSMLSMETGTKLTGRTKQIELFPFSFREFLRYNNFIIEEKDFYLAEKKIPLLQQFTQWLDEGGLPEYLLYQDRDYVSTLFDNILYRDIIVRHGIRKVKEFRELVLLLSKNLTLPVTYSSLQKAIGISNADSVREYLGFLSDAYMFYELRQFHHSFRKQLRNPRKIYLNDPAFHNLTGFNHSKNPGRKLENAVYLELRRKGMELYTFKGKGECDFVSFGSDRNITLIQVCYELHSENEKREVDGIVEAMNYFGLNSGIILTYDQERSISFEDRSIQILPVWKWMLVAE
jgi:hypothetical protein